MITLYSGTPRSGKSLHSAEKIYWRVRAGKPVIANFEINESLFKNHANSFLHIPNKELCPQDLVQFSRWYYSQERFSEQGILLVLDECARLFNARTWNVPGREEWLEFFQQSGKYGYYIILIAQFDRMIDRQIRELIEYNEIHRRVSNFGIAGKIFSLIGIGKLFAVVKVWRPINEKSGTVMFVARKKYMRIYNSYKDFGE